MSRDDKSRLIDVVGRRQDQPQWPAYSGYKRLNRNKQEIRILTIEPEGHTLVCSLRRVPLLEAGQYFALSYVWGESLGQKSIILGDEEVLIRQTLWKFLKSLRDTKGRVRVWADAICINQLDIPERDYQVTMMADIFRNAEGVIAWLGDVERSHRLGYISDDLDSYAITPRRRRRLEQLCDFNWLEDTLMSPYWLRLWIIQEVVLGKRVWFMITNEQIEFDDLLQWFNKYCDFHGWNTEQRVLQPLDTYPVRFEFSQRRPYVNQTSQEQRSKLGAGLLVFDTIARLRCRTSRVSLFTLAKSFRYAECQDPRDHIYGLLGIVDPEERRKVIVDYSCPVLEVYLKNVGVWASADAQDRMLEDGAHLYDGFKLVENLTQFTPVIGPFRDIFDLQRLREDEFLRSQVTTELTIRCERIRGRPDVRTFALYDSSSRQIVSSTKKSTLTRSQDVVNISIVTGAFAAGETSETILMFSTTNIDINDFFLSLPMSENKPRPSIILIARHVGHEVQIVGTGKRIEVADRIFRPDVWLAFQMPNVCHKINRKPFRVVRKGNSSYHVKFNGMAIAQLLEDDKYMASFGLWDVTAFSREHEILGIPASASQTDVQASTELEEELAEEKDEAWVYNGGFNRFASALPTEGFEAARSSWRWA